MSANETLCHQAIRFDRQGVYVINLKRIFYFIIFFLLHSSWAFELSVEEKIADLHQLVAQIKSGYGPLQYKKEKLGLDIDLLSKEFEERITKTKTNAQFYYELLKFVASFHDGHFYANIPSTAVANAHFVNNYVDGKVLIDVINRSKLEKEMFPFEKGDEVLEIDGVSVQKFIDEYSQYKGSGYDLTEKSLAVYRMTYRPAKSVPLPTSQVVTFKIRRGLSDIVEEVTLPWDFSGHVVDEFDGFSDDEKSFGDFVRPYNLDNLSIREDIISIVGSKQIDSTYHCSGDTRVSIPKDATIIMKRPFVAYFHPTSKGNIGYLRIPHYSPQDQAGNPEYDLRFSQYQYALSILEKQTVGLVIDQDHNCGGSVDYLQKIIGLFTKEKFTGLQFQFLANKAEFLDFMNWLNSTDDFTLEHLQVKNIYDLIKASWKNGEYMTPKTTFFGNQKISPNATVNYSHPVLMLINQWAGSGGDAFPSMMQGLGRAKLFGKRTSGLGGHVVETPPLNYSRIHLNMTKSLFYRPDGVPVENNGAVPDFKYEITRDDFLYEYKGYQKAYLKALMDMIETPELE